MDWSAVVPASVIVTCIGGEFKVFVDLSDSAGMIRDEDCEAEVCEVVELPHGHRQHRRRDADPGERDAMSMMFEAALAGLGRDVAGAAVDIGGGA
jgi:hypothetical protein